MGNIAVNSPIPVEYTIEFNRLDEIIMNESIGDSINYIIMDNQSMIQALKN